MVIPTPDPQAPAGEAVRFAMANGTLRLMQHDAPTRLGEVEGVHQMRVATRRLRGDIGTFGPLIDAPWADALVDELRWLGDLLGAVRDRDVQLASLASDDADLQGDLMQLRTAIATARDNAREELMDALAGSRYLDLLERMVQAARDPLLTDAAGLPAAGVVPDLLARTADRTRGRLKDVQPDSPDPTYHAARIGAKNLRYAAEAIGPFVARRAGRIRDIAIGRHRRAGRPWRAPGRARHAAAGAGDHGGASQGCRVRLCRRPVRRAPGGTPPRAPRTLSGGARRVAQADEALGRAVSEGTIRAAGGVLWRNATDADGPAAIEVAVIHRQRYDDWSLPKGKLAAGEREVDGGDP